MRRSPTTRLVSHQAGKSSSMRGPLGPCVRNLETRRWSATASIGSRNEANRGVSGLFWSFSLREPNRFGVEGLSFFPRKTRADIHLERRSDPGAIGARRTALLQSDLRSRVPGRLLAAQVA